MSGFARCLRVGSALIVGLVSSLSLAREPLWLLDYRLTPEESDAVVSASEALVMPVLQLARARGFRCSLEPLNPRRRPRYAIPEYQANAPVFPAQYATCEGPGGTGAVRVRGIASEFLEDFERSGAPAPGERSQPSLRWADDNSFHILVTQRGELGQFRAVRLDVDRGLQLIAQALDDATLFSLASRVQMLPRSHRPPPQRELVDVRSEEAAVVDGLLSADELVGGNGKAVVVDEPARPALTIDESSSSLAEALASELDRGLLSAFASKLVSGSLPSLPQRASLVAPARVEALMKKTKAPIVRLSPIAFSSTGNQAMVFASIWRNSMNGMGAVFVLHRLPASGEWRVLYFKSRWSP